MPITKINYNQIKSAPVNLADFGAVGNGVANDTTPWTNFIAACVTNNKMGYVPSGVYLIDSFIFTSAHTGLILYGESANAQYASTATIKPSVLKLRTASARFISIDNALKLTFDGISLDGGNFADNVLYYDGTTNNGNTYWSNSYFRGATAATGYTHRYAGTQGGESCVFFRCAFQSEFPATANHALAHVYMTNSNAILGRYDHCVFQDATNLINYEQGSGYDLIDCEFYSPATAHIEIGTYCAGITIKNAYTEGVTGKPFINQTNGAAAHNYAPIIIINPSNNNSGTCPMTFTCQQPVHIYGGKMGPNNIAINPAATWGVFPIIVDGVQFTTGAYTGTGVNTLLYERGSGNLSGGVWTAIAGLYIAASTASGGAVTTAVSWKAYKSDHLVTLVLPTTIGTAVGGVSINMAVPLPASFRPAATFFNVMVQVQINSAVVNVPGMVTVDSTGAIKIYRDATAVVDWGSAVSTGFYNCTVSWVV
jgi:hypothetical protein